MRCFKAPASPQFNFPALAHHRALIGSAVHAELHQTGQRQPLAQPHRQRCIIRQWHDFIQIAVIQCGDLLGQRGA
ncbi:hypothetical protein CXB77_16010 [Chromatium okenii]|uniref:Uncharacterized protein n=1 Tax=Chromatium okenii TaxID=61644 RepID=A0A2S7XQ87_9GAMM|nr:hypothetical protein CXB77_16010 [Chromatium okenii]